jgi:hypothetical protein
VRYGRREKSVPTIRTPDQILSANQSPKNLGVQKKTYSVSPAPPSPFIWVNGRMERVTDSVRGYVKANTDLNHALAENERAQARLQNVHREIYMDRLEQEYDIAAKEHALMELQQSRAVEYEGYKGLPEPKKPTPKDVADVVYGKKLRPDE